MLTHRFVRFLQHLTPATLWEVIDRTGRQRLPGLAAEMAYNSMLAMFPAILAMLTAIGLIEVSQPAFQSLTEQLSRFAPREVLGLVNGFVQSIRGSRNQGLFSLSFLGALWAASGAVSAAMTAIDQIYQIPASQMRSFWHAKLVSLGLTLGTIQLLVTASTLVFISDLIISLLVGLSGPMADDLLHVWRLFSWPLALGMVAVAFAFIYRYGPSRWVPGTPIIPGAVLAAMFWALLSALFRLYVSQFGQYNQAYGAIGAFIVLLLWLQLSSLMLLIGAQLNVTVGEAMQRSQRRRMLKVKG